MTSGAELVDAGRQFLGEPYSTAPGRTSPTSGHKDCSGFVCAAYEVATGQLLVPSTSSAQYRYCRDEGRIVPYEEGIRIAGALGFKPDNPELGIGPAGHVVMFVGDGVHTIEATPSSVRILPISYNAPFAPEVGLLPGIDYANGGHGGSQPEEDRMKPGLFLDAQQRVWVYDPNNHTKTHLRTVEALSAAQALRSLEGMDPNWVRNSTTDALLADARDIDAAAVPPGDCPDCPPGIDTATNDQLLAELDRRLP